MQYDKNKNVILILSPISIKYLPYVTNVSLSLISTNIKEGDCSNAWKFVARHIVNGVSQIQGFDFDQSYLTMAHGDSFIINIATTAMHRLTVRIFDVSNTL